VGIQIETGTPVNLSASGAIAARPGVLLGFYVNSTTSGTIVLTNGGSGGAAVSGTITPAVGWNRFPAYFSATTGPYATIGGAALNVTFIFQAD
jgi:hypothetical protein